MSEIQKLIKDPNIQKMMSNFGMPTPNINTKSESNLKENK